MVAKTKKHKRRGPPPTGKGQQIQIRLQPPAMAGLDTWIAEQPNPPRSRPEAIRRVIERGMAKCECRPAAEGA